LFTEENIYEESFFGSDAGVGESEELGAIDRKLSTLFHQKTTHNSSCLKYSENNRKQGRGKQVEHNASAPFMQTTDSREEGRRK